MSRRDLLEMIEISNKDARQLLELLTRASGEAWHADLDIRGMHRRLAKKIGTKRKCPVPYPAVFDRYGR